MLDLNKLMRAGAESAEETLAFDLSQEDFGGHAVPQPVTLHYKAVPEGGAVRLELQVDADIEAPCARCLETAQQPVHIETSYQIWPQELREDFPQLPIVKGGLLDLRELAYGELVIEAPGAILCKEDCAGLCQSCGKPAAGCDCPAETEGDPRWQALRDLLKESDDKT
ncbi:MAG: hypothetical protein GXY32_05155 [Ruminococcaceae bacterium]|nr:hypothetical protein [Oscillospiraceae bacterium]